MSDAPPQSAGSGSAVEARHLALFDELDFKAWNSQDWDGFRRLHAPDVIVEMLGNRTESVEPHVAMCRDVWSAVPKSKILAHPVSFASGEWSCTIGELETGQKMVTVARWRDDRVAEEYIFMSGLVPPYWLVRVTARLRRLFRL